MTTQELIILTDLSNDEGEVWTKGNKQSSAYFKKNKRILQSLYAKGYVMSNTECCGTKFYLITNKGQKALEEANSA